LTSCGRFDLLAVTLATFVRFNTYPNCRKIIIVDDSGLPNAGDEVRGIVGSYRDRVEATILVNQENIGQVASIDRAYAYVDTDYVFHMEDDWEFYDTGFIEISMSILRDYPWIVTTWLRSHSDTMGHPIEYLRDLPFPLLTLGYLHSWHGSTWNPGLRRLRDYMAIGSFSHSAPSELLASQLYLRRGFRAAIAPMQGGYIRHIGWERSTSDPDRIIKS
jgi:hypothetical protein